MPTNSDVEPWRPDANALPGTPPTVDGPGERGSSAMTATNGWTANSQQSDPAAATRGPASGVTYYADEFPQAIATGMGTTPVREDASTS